MNVVQTANENNIYSSIFDVLKVQKKQGDIWPVLYTQQAMSFYSQLNSQHKIEFLSILSKEFGSDSDEFETLMKEYLESKTTSGADRNSKLKFKIRNALTPLYEQFFERVNQLPGGLSFLVNMRKDIMSAIRDNQKDLECLDLSLKAKLQTWFSPGFLDLERISWTSSAAILEKIIAYEAVHAISSWKDLKQRVNGAGRMCFSFFHRGMPLEPLTFIEIALVHTISDNIQSILANESTDVIEPSVAIFYSISSSQPGLSGIDLGNFLIKRVVKELVKHTPSVKTFCTLSPIPNFSSWLRVYMENKKDFLSEQEYESLFNLFNKEHSPQKLMEMALLDLKDEKIQNCLKPILIRLCRVYLFDEKHRGYALDKVCHFHIRNGAFVYRINWMGDVSDKGMKQSFGLMVNYIYILDKVEENNSKYLVDGVVREYDKV